MSRIVVQKFGGTSVGSLERFRAAAERVLAARSRGKSVVVVVSAMAKETDRLLALGASASSLPDRRELDALCATGESASAALMALTLQSYGAKARSFQGFQVPLRTDSTPGNARILSVGTASVLDSLGRDEIPVVAGFQGIDTAGRVTTLGRGGSDTTAVALASALRARCEIFTDVKGVYSADPRVCAEAELLPQVSYRFMIEAAGLGAKVVHDRSVALGMRYEVPIEVKSSFVDEPGTTISGKETPADCITVSPGNAFLSAVSLIGRSVANPLETIPAFLGGLSREHIPCFGLNQGPMSLSFFVPRPQSENAARLFHHSLKERIAC